MAASNGAIEPRRETLGRWGLYLAKAAVLLALLCSATANSPYLPPWCVAALWSMLSAILSVGLGYPYVVRKLHRQLMLQEDGYLARINGGRCLTLLICFVLSSLFVGGLIFETPKWQVLEWALFAASVPLYVAAYAVAFRVSRKEYRSQFQAAGAMRLARLGTAVVLCVAYAGLSALFPAESYGTLLEAYQATPRPFAQSGSALLSEVGDVKALVDGFTAYGMSVSATHPVVLMVVKALLMASAFYGIATALGLCSLGVGELQLVFAPLRNEPGGGSAAPTSKLFVAFLVVLSIAFGVVLIVADSEADAVIGSAPYQSVRVFVREQVNITAYSVFGKYYDPQAVDGLYERLKADSERMAEERREALEPLINASFDARVANVDGYLDWYYSLPADYERLAGMVTGTAEELVAGKLRESLESGVDDSELEGQLASFRERAEELRDEAAEELEKYELHDVPEWAIKAKDELDPVTMFDGPLQATKRFLGSSERFGISGASGVVAGLIAAKLSTKLAGKAFFKSAVSKIASKLLLGAVASTGIAAVIGIGVDYALLAYDELQNRESYKAEIVGGIEEQRAETLALLAS